MKIVGIILVVLGVSLAVWGYQLSGSFGSQITETFTGAPPDKVMVRYIAGAISAAVGVFLLVRR